MSAAGAASGESPAARDPPAPEPSLDPRRRRQRRAIDNMRSHADASLREARLPEPALSAMAQRHKHPIRVHSN
jgi:hypothetical protein